MNIGKLPFFLTGPSFSCHRPILFLYLRNESLAVLGTDLALPGAGGGEISVGSEEFQSPVGT